MRRTALKRQGPLGRARTARLRALRPQILKRWGARCANPWCWAEPPVLDLHHVVKRSQCGADTLENVVPLCRRCHEATDRPSGQEGKLVITRGYSDATHEDGARWVAGFWFWWV